MSSEPMQAGQWSAPRWLKLVIFALLALHTVWVAVHLRLVSEGAINPWKLGGYGMYTVPHPFPRLHVFAINRETRTWSELSVGTFSSYRFDLASDLHTFNCRMAGASALSAFLDDNPHLRRMPLTLALSRETMTEEPIGARRQIYATTEIAWSDAETFTYRSEVCGSTSEGRVTYAAPG
ncbi:MAG: hypothetical protein AAFP17_15445 [Pseudomonadota bacterium]